MTAVGAMILDYKLREKSPYSNWRVVFDFSIVTYSLLLIYHLVVLVRIIVVVRVAVTDMGCIQGWTYTHLYHPHIDDSNRG